MRKAEDSSQHTRLSVKQCGNSCKYHRVTELKISQYKIYNYFQKERNKKTKNKKNERLLR